MYPPRASAKPVAAASKQRLKGTSRARDLEGHASASVNCATSPEGPVSDHATSLLESQVTSLQSPAVQPGVLSVPSVLAPLTQ